MKMPRKLTSLLLLICLLFSATQVIAKPVVENEAVIASPMVEKLEKLGVWDASYQLSDTVTRGEFASVVADLMNISGNGTVFNENLFADVPSDNPYYKDIMYLSKLGIVSGGNNTYFNPDELVTYDQVAKMIVTALGYRVYAEYEGGYPAGYLTALIKYKLIPSSFIRKDSYTFADIAGLIDYVIDVPYLKQENFGDNAEYAAKEDITILSIYHNIYKTKGVLTAVGTRRIKPGSELNKEEIEIGEEIYINNSNKDYDLLGYNVTGYYLSTSSIKDEYMLYVEKYGKSEELSIDCDLIQNFDSGNITYFETKDSVKPQKVTIPKTAYVLYNYNYIGTYSQDDVLKADNLSLIDSDRDGAYDILNIVKEDTIVVSGINYTDQVIYDKYGSSILDLHNNAAQKRNIKIYKANGLVADVSEIGEDSVLSVIKDKDENNIDITVSNDKKTGTVEEISNGDTQKENTYTIGGADYILANNAERINNLNTLGIGKSVTVLLNFRGDIAGIKYAIISGKESYGYIVDAVNPKTALSKAKLYLYTMQNTLEEFNVSENARFDNVKIKAADIYQYLMNVNAANNSVQQLIRYTLNESGEIKEIDTPLSVSNDDLLNEKSDLTRWKNFENTYYHKDFKVFFGNFRIDPSTIIIFVPKSEEYKYELTSYGIKNISEFTTGTYDLVETYDVKPDRTAGVIVVRSDNGGGVAVQKSTAVMVVQKIASVIDENGIAKTKIYGLRNGLEISLVMAENCSLTQQYKASNGSIVSSTVEEGDMIRVGTNTNGEISDYYKVFSLRDRDDANVIIRGKEAANPKTYTGSLKATMIQYTGNAQNATDVKVGRVWQGSNQYWFTGVDFSLEFGIVKERYGGVLVVESIGGTNGDNKNTIQRYINMTNRYVYVIDEVNNQIRKGSIDEIVAANDDSYETASRVIYGRYSDVPSFIAVVKRK